MSNLSKPVKGIHELKLIEKATEQGAKSLLHLLAPNQYMEGTSIAALQMNCIYGLIEQIKLRDTYIHLCMKDLGMDTTVPEQETTEQLFDSVFGGK